MKRSVKIGVFGLGRGSSFYKSIMLNNGDIVAVCDKREEALAEAKEKIGSDVAAYTDFDEFINHEGMEAVFLCNYFHEHTPYAIKALERNIHVLSECTSNATMAEGVVLVRAAEKSKAIYMLSENYPFMQFNLEMKRVYEGGTLGKVLFAEGEYNHPLDPFVEPDYFKQLHPYPNHWRNWLPRTYYITHSLAPLMNITGAFPKRVTAMPVYKAFEQETLSRLAIADRSAIITILNTDDSVFRVTGCAGYGAHSNSYRLCCENGQIENVRGGDGKVMLRYNKWQIPEGLERNNYYSPSWNDPEEELIEQAGHGGGDFLVMREFLNCIRENKQPKFDVYFATAMASVAILSHRSLLEYGVPYDIPDFRLEEDRAKYENDTLTPFWGTDGSAPTIRAESHDKYVPTPDEMERYMAILNS